MITNACAVLFIISASAATAPSYPDPDFTVEDDVYKLHDEDFEKFLEKYPTALVEFYAPWCGHCKSLTPEYAAAARTLREHKQPVQLAKVDATAEKELAKKFIVTGFPTLKFWQKDKTDPVEYEGPRDHAGIVTWLRERIDPNYKPPASDVIALTKDTFDSFVGDKEIVLVEFYAPWCGHCKKIAPELDIAARKLKQHQPHPILIAKVDGTIETELAKEYGVAGYPTMKILRKGKRFDYTGPREADGIIKYMTEQAKPAAQSVDSLKTAKRMCSHANDVTVIGFFVTDEDSAYENFIAAGEELREEYKNYVYTTDPSIIKGLQAQPNTVRVCIPDKWTSKHEPSFREMKITSPHREDIVSFVQKSSTPMVGHRTRAHLSRFSERPLVVVYYTVDFSLEHIEGTQYWRNKVLTVAARWTAMTNYKFAVSDEEEFQDELIAAGIGDSGMEVNVIVYGKDNKKYPWNPDKFGEDEFNEKTFEKFMKALSENKIKPHVKSAPVPKDSDSAVKAVVASTFDRIVRDESKDVLIEFYAPWCGHCKVRAHLAPERGNIFQKLEPVYLQLAQKLAGDTKLVLAKYDATANDAPDKYEAEGFPTIYFAPKGRKDTPIKYTGNRDPDDLVKFMKQHSVVSFVGSAKTEL